MGLLQIWGCCAAMLELQEGQEAGRVIRQRWRRAGGTEWEVCWLTEEQQRMHSQYYTLMPLLEHEDPGTFQHLTRIPPDMWHHILQCVSPDLTKKDTNMRLAMEPVLKCWVALNILYGYTCSVCLRDLVHVFICHCCACHQPFTEQQLASSTEL